MTEHEQLLLNKMDHLREVVELKFSQHGDRIEGICKRMDTTNGQVAKNTKFRNQSKIYIAAALGILGLIVPVAQSLVSKALERFIA